MWPFDQLIQGTRTIFTETIHKPTGLENLTHRELVEGLYERQEKSGSKCHRLTQGWAETFREDLARSGVAEPYRQLLRQRLEGAAVIELGVGKNAGRHHTLFTSLLGAGSYCGVDRRAPLAGLPYTHVADLLTFLAEQPTRSAHIAAFGLFNEPMMVGDFACAARSPHDASLAHYENEHLRRLCREIERVLIDDGLFFGSGLFPLGSIKTSEEHLKQAGIIMNDALSKEAHCLGIDVISSFATFFMGRAAAASEELGDTSFPERRPLESHSSGNG